MKEGEPVPKRHEITWDSYVREVNRTLSFVRQIDSVDDPLTKQFIQRLLVANFNVCVDGVLQELDEGNKEPKSPSR